MADYRIHSGGVWSSQRIASRARNVMKLYDKLDQHFGTRFHQLIESSREDLVAHFAERSEAAERSVAATQKSYSYRIGQLFTRPATWLLNLRSKPNSQDQRVAREHLTRP
jgi:hypothetical protein